MKSTSGAVTTLLANARAGLTGAIVVAECFTLQTIFGTSFYWTSYDLPIVYSGHTFLATGPQIQGLKFKQTATGEVDRQQVTIAAKPTDLINGVPFLAALAQGYFDGQALYRDRVFLTGPGGTVVGGVRLFQGKVSTVDEVGRVSARLTVASDLVVLEFDMPRNLFQPTCLNNLYDANCGVVKASFTNSGSCADGSTATTISWSGALARHAQGALKFTSGANSGVTLTVRKAAAGSSLTLFYPAPNVPATGDTFTVAAGCDRTQNTCQSVFSNVARFRGFPYVPPPVMAV